MGAFTLDLSAFLFTARCPVHPCCPDSQTHAARQTGWPALGRLTLPTLSHQPTVSPPLIPGPGGRSLREKGRGDRELKPKRQAWNPFVDFTVPYIWSQRWPHLEGLLRTSHGWRQYWRYTRPKIRRLRSNWTRLQGCASSRCTWGQQPKDREEQQQQPLLLPPRPPPSRSKLAPCAMVTHSKFPATGMNRPLDTSLRLKTFSSKSEYQLVVNAVRKLQESGFYWSAVTGGEANLLLSAEPAGTFLIRDSSDQRHFFTLSVKTQSGTKNLRIQCEGGSFSLQSDPRSTQPVPRFDCVLKLVQHYMPPNSSSSSTSSAATPSSSLQDQMLPQALSGAPPKRTYYIYSGGEKIPLVLSRPLSSNVASLQHLCRKTVNGHLDSYEKVTQLPGPIREFLDQYDAPL